MEFFKFLGGWGKCTFLRLLMHVAELPSRRAGPSDMEPFHPDQFTDSRLYPWKRSAEEATG